MTREQARRRLSETIAAWKAANPSDKHGIAVCHRLNDSEAATAFRAIRPDGLRWDVLLGDCITAERIARELPDVVSRAKKTKDDALAARERIAWLGQYLQKCPGRVTEALAVLGEAVYVTEINSDRVLAERSRRADPKAALSAGIGWLKEAVLRASGAPNHEHVGTLATAALGTPEAVTVDSVRKAVMPSDAIWEGYSAAKGGPSDAVVAQSDGLIVRRPITGP